MQHCLHPKTAAFHLAGSLLREQGMKELLCITLAYGKDSQLDRDPYDLLVGTHDTTHAQNDPLTH